MKKNIHFSHSRFLSGLAIAILSIFILIPGLGWGQLFTQNFSGSNVVADYVSATPNNGQFNKIDASNTLTTFSINSGILEFIRTSATASVGSFSRTTDFSPTPNTLLYKVTINVSGNNTAATSVAVFQLGSGFGTANSVATNANTYARFAINFSAIDGTWQIRDITNGTNTADLTGSQNITWALNNSGSTITYLAPDGTTTESLADDKADIWAGTTMLFNDIGVETATQTLTDLKFVFTGGNSSLGTGTIQIDNILIDPIPAPPTAYAVTGTDSYCQGSGGLPVGVANSEVGVTYTISPGGATVAGTGAAISFGNQLAGTYTVSGTNGGGTTAMTGSAVITENSRPTSIVSGGGTICSGVTLPDVSIALTGTGPWDLTYSDGTTSTPVTVINSSPYVISQATAGVYTVTALKDANCTAQAGDMTGMATVTVNPLPTATATSNSPVTEGGTLNLIGGADGLDGYSWSGPGYSNSTQSPSITNVTLAAAGTYTLTVTDVNLCTAQASTDVVIYPQINWAAVTSPISGTISLGDNFSVSAEVWEPGITDAAGQGAGITAWIGYSTTDSDPSTWTNWVLASYSSDIGNNDIYIGNIGADLTATGTYYYASRFKLNSAGYVYGASSGFWNGVVSISRVLTVNPPNQIDWANLQYPASWTIATGGNLNVFARVYELGVTNNTGQGAGITAWIGYSTTNTNPNLWTDWVAATYNIDAGNDDEYMANIGTLLPAGTYYYASRFKFGLADYVYGGLNGFWNGTSNPSGVLTVTAPPTSFAVTGTGSYCTVGLPVGLDGSEVGVTYTITPGGGTAIGTGSAISFGNRTAGTYTVSGSSNGVVPTISGTTAMTGSAVITIAATPTAYAGADDLVTAGIPYSLSGATASQYISVSWAKTGGVGTGTFNDNNLVNPTFTGTSDGPITLTLTANGCSTTATSDITLYIISANPVTWYGATDGNWNIATNWFPAFVPTADYNVLISSSATNYPTILSTDAAECKNITLESGASIKGNEYLSVSGTQTIERIITTGKWHYISAANNNTNSGKFTGDFLQSWDEPTAAWTYITATNANLNPVQGYSLWVKTSAGASKKYSFTGAFNTGAQSTGLTFTSGSANGNDGANFLGNPYPSYIDWDGLRTSYGAIYYWNGTAYVTWNNGGAGSRYVSPMQGFFIVAFANGIFNLGDGNRTNNSASYYKSSSDINANSLLLATIGESYSDKLFVNFNPAATEGFDLQNDAYKFLGYTAGVSELYSYTGDKKLSIDVRPESQVIQLGFTNTKSGDYQIGIDKVADIPVAYLEDTKTNTFHDLLTGPYAFSYTAGESDKRFLLHFGTTGIKETGKDAASIYSYQKTVYINMVDQSKGDIFIYNMAGQQVATRTSALGMNEIKLPNTGNYIVKVISKNSTVVRKVFIQ